MEKEQKLIELGEKVWRFRKENGFSKKIPIVLQTEAAKLCQTGVTAYAIGKALGIPRNTISEWTQREKPVSTFSEVPIVEEKSTESKFQIKVFSEIQGCHVEITGKDFPLLQRLLRKLGN